jgi:hypothetical protein
VHTCEGEVSEAQRMHSAPGCGIVLVEEEATGIQVTERDWHTAKVDGRQREVQLTVFGGLQTEPRLGVCAPEKLRQRNAHKTQLVILSHKVLVVHVCTQTQLSTLVGGLQWVHAAKVVRLLPQGTECACLYARAFHTVSGRGRQAGVLASQPQLHVGIAGATHIRCDQVACANHTHTQHSVAIGCGGWRWGSRKTN